MDPATAFVLQMKNSKKYRSICEETVLDVLRQELNNHGSFKKAVPAAKERLHKLWAEFLGVPNYKKLGKRLSLAFATDDTTEIETVCMEILGVHASAQERISLFEENYYGTLFGITGKPKKLADFACALHPFSFRWMGLDPSVDYYAYDINKDFTDFIQQYFQLEGISPLVFWQDIYVNIPEQHFDIVLIFKMFHCLEHRRKGAGLELLKKTNADWLAVSFPKQNLHGKKADIYGNYSAKIEETGAALNWHLQRVDFSNEVLLIIKKIN